MVTLPDLSQTLLFVVHTTALVLAPGPAALFIIARSLDGGTKDGLLAVLGITLGTSVHVLIAGAGASLLTLSGEYLTVVTKLVGGGFFLFVGLQRLLHKEPYTERSARATKGSGLAALFQGILLNLLNPKAAILVFVFLPQFIDVDRGGIGSQIRFLGALYLLIGLMVGCVYALLAGQLRHKILLKPEYAKILSFVSGGIYLAIGCTIVFVL